MYIYFLGLIFSALFGTFAKIADVLEEHGLKWFYGSNIFFGLLWGFMGGLTILNNFTVGTFWIAIVLQWICRGKIDRPSHGIGASIMILVYIYLISIGYNIEWNLLIVVIPLFILVSIIKKIILLPHIIIDYNIYIFILLIIWSIWDPQLWIIFLSFLVNTIFYQGTKRVGGNIITRQQKELSKKMAPSIFM